ncbi:MAG: hypothetical protein HQM16_14620 [Deltaproteobacteria bacterium]|nr:hypothetical protein [Deltaproteobacteria bacterium]
MYRNDRYFNKKRNGQHNFYGEEDDVEIKKGRVCSSEHQDDNSSEEEDLNHEDEGG